MGVTVDALRITWDYHSLGLTRVQFHSPEVTPLTNHTKVMDQRLCYTVHVNASRWHDCHQSGVITIADQLIFQNGKSQKST